MAANSRYSFETAHINSIKKVAVFGATGQVGTPLVRTLLERGHQVVAVSRGRSGRNKPRLADLESRGAQLAYCEDLGRVDEVAGILEGCDTLIASVRAEKNFLVEVEPKLLEAALKAGVKRFVPNEFGAHTQGMPMGCGEIFDHKKRFQELLFASGLEWTLYYNGGIFDYFLPNLRFFKEITTFGDLDLPLYTHHIRDIGHVAALASSGLPDRQQMRTTRLQCLEPEGNACITQTVLAGVSL